MSACSGKSRRSTGVFRRSQAIAQSVYRSGATAKPKGGIWVLRDRVRAVPIDSTQDRENALGISGGMSGVGAPRFPRPADCRPFAAVFGTVEKRLAETHIPPNRPWSRNV